MVHPGLARARIRVSVDRRDLHEIGPVGGRVADTRIDQCPSVEDATVIVRDLAIVPVRDAEAHRQPVQGADPPRVAKVQTLHDS